MKLGGTCGNCGRAFLVEQAIGSGGRCPWCSTTFQKDYAATLVDALRIAEESGSALASALERIAEMKPDLTLDLEPLLGAISATQTPAG